MTNTTETTARQFDPAFHYFPTTDIPEPGHYVADHSGQILSARLSVKEAWTANDFASTDTHVVELATRFQVAIDTDISTRYETWIRLFTRDLDDQKRVRRAIDTKDDRYLTQLHETMADRAPLLAEARNLLTDAENNYQGWSRFFLVPGGHIHSSMQCSTCNKGGNRTQFGWLPALSGLTDADAVEEWGGILCTVCFPDAPTEWTEGTNKKDAETKALEDFGELAKHRAQLPKSEKLLARAGIGLAEAEAALAKVLDAL